MNAPTEDKIAELVQHDLTQAPVASDRQLFMAGITGLGYYVPERVLTNADLERMVETNDEWIRSRTGIRERRLADAGGHAADMAAAGAGGAAARRGTAR